MESLIEKGSSVIETITAKVKSIWSGLTTFDKAIVGGVIGVTGSVLLTSTGMLFSGALFGLIMLANVIILATIAPPVAYKLVKNRGKLDVIATVSGIVYGFLSGSVTVVLGMAFLGLLLSATLRIAGQAEEYFKDTSEDWKKEHPLPSWINSVNNFFWFKGKEETIN